MGKVDMELCFCVDDKSPEVPTTGSRTRRRDPIHVSHYNGPVWFGNF